MNKSMTSLNARHQHTPPRRLLGLMLGCAIVAWASAALAVDYNGQDVTIVTETEWSGEHTNIRNLIISERGVLRAAQGQTLRIEANNIEVYGAITADQAGASGGAPGERGRGGAGGQGQGSGSNGADGAVCGRPGIDYNAGGGGGGAGSFIGRGGGGGAGADANDGGCQGANGGGGGANTDSLTPRLGAGGGGGGGAGGRRNAQGSAGERGGGILIIETKSLRVEGRISADGGQGGVGGTSPDFFHGGGGGGGASGGTITIQTTYLIGTGDISARGGQGGNGGQGDLVGQNSFTGAGGGGGGGGLVIIEFANDGAFNGQCQVEGGAPGTGSNTNGDAGSAGGAGRCVRREINGTPTAIPGGPYIGVEGLPVNLNGSNSIDPDGDNLNYEWDCDDDGTFELNGPAVQCIFNNDGTFNVALRVTDPQNESDTAFAEVIVTEGPPVAALTGPERVDEGDTVSLDASASDGFGDAIVSYEWDFEYDGNFQADETTDTPNAQTTFCDNGVFTVAVRTTDDGGSNAVALHRVIVTNVTPSVTNDAPSAAQEGQSYTHTLDVDDPGCDEISYTFITRPEGMQIDNNGTVTFRPTFRQALEGETLVRVLVSDDDFGRFTYEWAINVTPTDEDQDQLPDTWEQFFGLNPNNPTDARQDDDGDGRDNLTEFNAGTNPTEFDGPTRPRLSAPRQDSEVNTSTPVLRSFRAQSPINAPLTYEVELYNFVDDVSLLSPELLVAQASALTPEDNSPSLEWTVPESAELQDHTRYCWRMRALDTLVPGNWSDLWCFFVNNSNETPSPPELLVPADGAQLDNGLPTLTVNNCVDPDEDPLSYTFILYRGEGIATPVTSAANLPEGQDGMTSWTLDLELDENTNYCWRAQCRDNEGLASEYSEVGCFFINRENDLPDAPLIISPVPEPGEAQARVDEIPVAVVIRNSEDPEGDPVLYRFQLDTSVTFDSPDLVEEEIAESPVGETTWNPEVTWVDNTIYHIRVQASDGQGASAFASGEFFLNFENDPPAPPTLRAPINNTLISSRQPTLTIVNAQDPDGDTLRYSFEIYSDEDLQLPVDRRGGVEETPETTQYRVTSTQLVDGTYYWRATASDGVAESVPSEVGVFIIRSNAPSPGDDDDNSDGNNDGGNGGNNSSTGGADGGGCTTASPQQRGAPLGALTLALLALGIMIGRRRT